MKISLNIRGWGDLLREVESVTLFSVIRLLFGTFISFQRKTFLSKFRMDLEVTEAWWVLAGNDRVAVGFGKAPAHDHHSEIRREEGPRHGEAEAAEC